MAKGPGDTRTSRWPRHVEGSREGEIKDLYFRDGRRAEYGELTQSGKNAVKRAKNEIADNLYQKLKGTTTPQTIDNGERIGITYTKDGLRHFANDAMLTLSGKYFSENSMMRVNEILAQSRYVPTEHGLKHERKDSRELWFSYTDADGRGVYFKVAYNSRKRKYDLYSVTDKL